MPIHNYTPIPLEDEHFSRSYNTGIPSTAPPSFQTVPPSFSKSTFSQRDNDSGATIIRNEKLPPTDNAANDDSAISIWAPSESQFNHDLEAAREDTLVRLINRVEQIELRLNSNGDGGLNTSIEKTAVDDEKEWSCGGWKLSEIIPAVIGVCLLIWFCAIVTLWIASKYRAAGFPPPGSAGKTVTANDAGNAGMM